MGWPFQLKILWSYFFEGKVVSLENIFKRLSIHSLVQFLLVQYLAIGLLRDNLINIFIIGSIININSCFTTLLVFKAKSLIIKRISGKNIAILTKVGRKFSVSFIAGLIITVSQHYSWALSYQASAFVFLIYALFNIYLIIYQGQQKTSCQSPKTNYKSAENELLVWFKKLDSHPLFPTFVVFTLINIGHHLLTGWTTIYLREIGFDMSLIINQKFISFAAYGLGLSYSYFFCKKDSFIINILALSVSYSIITFGLNYASILSINQMQALLFLKSAIVAALLVLKYAWMTSFCAEKKDAIITYSFLMTVSNMLTFIGSIMGGWIMAYFSWKLLFTTAAIANIPGIMGLLFLSKKHIKSQLSYL